MADISMWLLKAADQIKACGNRDKFLRRRRPVLGAVRFARAVGHFLALAGGPELKVGPRPYLTHHGEINRAEGLHERCKRYLSDWGRWECFLPDLQ